MADSRREQTAPLSVDTSGRRLSSTALSRPSTSSMRPPSSIGFSRPPSSLASPRPASSASLRPPSSASIRHISSASTNRPSSAASFRPTSQASHRPASRFSYRPPRQMSRLYSLAEELVSKITGDNGDAVEDDDFMASVDYVVRNLDQGGAPSVGFDKIHARVRGMAQKARIRSHDTWAEALEQSYLVLKTRVQAVKDLDQEITPNRLPEHVQFLIALSSSSPDLSVAQDYLYGLRNPPQPMIGITWKSILAEEPFEGQHWEGVYGLPPGSTVEGWETMSLDSTPPLSPLDYIDDRSLSPPRLDLDNASRLLDETPSPEPIKQSTFSSQRTLFDHKKDVETLQSKQYWRKEWRTDATVSNPFDLNDPSSLGPSMMHSLHEESSPRAIYIHEHDVIREILIGLQGRRNMVIEWTVSNSTFSFQPILGFPRVVHLSLKTQQSILSRFAQLATTLEHLRKFISKVYASVNKTLREPTPSSQHGHNKRITHAIEAFAEALAAELQAFDQWCALYEQKIMLAAAGTVEDVSVTFLTTEKNVRDAFSNSFDVLLDCLRDVMRTASRAQDQDDEVWVLVELHATIPPATLSSNLLDSLFNSAQHSISMGHTVTHDTLSRVFVAAAQPLWSMIGRWIRDGIPVRDGTQQRSAYTAFPLDSEFFIEDNELLIFDPDFWTEGFALREFEGIDTLKPLPAFAQLIASHVLAAGKAVGLTRALSGRVLLDEQSVDETWPELSDIVTETRLYSHEDLARSVYDRVLPLCVVRENYLAAVITQEFRLDVHLLAIHDIYLMRRGDIASTFADVLFAKIDSGQNWTDYHFLNSSLRDVIEAETECHISASAFRLTYQGRRDMMESRESAALQGLHLEYAAPFPFTYIFGPDDLKAYNSVFVLLLQIRRSKNALEKTLVRTSNSTAKQDIKSMKTFYALRSKLAWFIGGLLDYITLHVLHAEVIRIEKKLKAVGSLDEIIALHHESLERLCSRCFLQHQASRATIRTILDICLRFGDRFTAFTGAAASDIDPRFLTHKHRSRKAARLRRNVIGFDLPPADSSDDEDDAGEELEGWVPETSFATSISFAGLDFFGQIDLMSKELDSLVRSLRRGVETLAGDTTESASTFGIFAFTLEDWDR